MKAGIRLEHIEPGKPHQNGRHERFHLTLQQETTRPPAHDMRTQQQRFDAFREEYNDHRPHEALGQRPPSSVYVESRRSFSGKLREPEYPSDFEIVVPNSAGSASFRHNWIFISQALRHERVGIVEVEESCFAVYFCDRLLGYIHLSHPELGLIAA
jgi:putative transposase